MYGDTSDLEAANVSINGYINGDPQTDLILYEGERACPSHPTPRLPLLESDCRPHTGIKKHSFGEGLEFQEQEWLAAVINDAIARAKEGGELGGIEDDDDDYEEDLR